jgi:tRNA A-37 threonylcarbamoyl transferase component Bud32
MGSADFVHGDLAARNCQVGSEGRALIGDYGLFKFKDDYYWSGNVAIPLRWAAPETLHCTINTIQTLKVRDNYEDSNIRSNSLNCLQFKM